jgi:hypothetical protein
MGPDQQIPMTLWLIHWLASTCLARCSDARAVGLCRLLKEMGGMRPGLLDVAGLVGGHHGPGNGAVAVRLLGQHRLVLGQGLGKLVVGQQDIGQQVRAPAGSGRA